MSRPDPLPLVAFVVPLALYVATAAPTVYHLDSAELTTAAATGGLMRATGYPLYLVLGRLWCQLPLGDAGYRMNLLSAVCGALTLVLAARVLRRLGAGPWAIFGALGLLATARFFWSLSLIAEVYTLHTALVAAVLLALLHWAERPTPRRLGLATLVVGLALGNHMATVLLAPACLVYVLATAPRAALAPRSLLWAAGGLAAGLAVYLYLPWTYSGEPAFNYAGAYDDTGRFVPVDLTTWRGVAWLVSGRSFADRMAAYDAAAILAETARFGAELGRAFLGVGLGPALVGIWALLRRDARLGSALLLMFVAHAGFYINYGVSDKDTMFLPAYLIWAIWLGVGYQWLLDWVGAPAAGAPADGAPADGAPAAGAPAHGRESAAGTSTLRAWMLVSVILAAVWNGPLVDLSDDRSARERGEAILRRVEPDALVAGWWDTVPVVEYLQLVEGRRPDVRALNRFLISNEDLERLVTRELERRPVYVDVPPEDLPEIEAEPAGMLFRLRAGRNKPDAP